MDDTHTLDPGGQGQSVIGLHFKPSMRPPSPGASTVPAPAWPGLLPSSLKDYTYVAAPWEALPQYKSSPIYPDPGQGHGIISNNSIIIFFSWWELILVKNSKS